MSGDGARREEILQTAATLFASSGLQTTLREISDTCGILPGSMYHHFESKEAIIVELVERYLDDLGRVADDALQKFDHSSSQPIEDSLVTFGRAIAACALRNRAALLLTLYEPPAIFGDRLVKLASQTPIQIEAAMVEMTRHGVATGEIRPRFDLGLLSERLCESMLHVGVGVSHLTPGAENVPEIRMRILLRGIAAQTPSNSDLDRSAALREAREVGARWEKVAREDDRTAHLRAVARAEFGRRGYESTTMRDIATAAGLSTGTVYRSFGSKDELMVSIMSAYTKGVKAMWDAVLSADSTPLEKLDALMWANIRVVDRFSDEFKIQLAWLRQSPPSSPNLDYSFGAQLRQIKSLLAQGSKVGDLRLEGGSADVRARCVFEAVMTSQEIIRASGARAAQTLARETVLRGALARSRSRK